MQLQLKQPLGTERCFPQADAWLSASCINRDSQKISFWNWRELAQSRRCRLSWGHADSCCSGWLTHWFISSALAEGWHSNTYYEKIGAKQLSTVQLQLKQSNYYAHRNMFPTGGSLTVSQLYKVRFLEDKLLKLAKNGQNQRVQTQFRPNILREMPGVPFRSWLPQYFVQNLDNDVHVCMS